MILKPILTILFQSNNIFIPVSFRISSKTPPTFYIQIDRTIQVEMFYIGGILKARVKKICRPLQGSNNSLFSGLRMSFCRDKYYNYSAGKKFSGFEFFDFILILYIKFK